jgi:uncharacterized MAPEG superfamily protein
MQLASTALMALANAQLAMTVPLWGLVIFILGMVAIVSALLVVRIRHLAAGGAIKDFATPNEASLLWRLFRVHANLSENLPLYLGVVFLLTVQERAGMAMDGLTGVYIGSRILHSVIHIVGMAAAFRLLSLITQLSCLVALVFLAVG